MEVSEKYLNFCKVQLKLAVKEGRPAAARVWEERIEKVTAMMMDYARRK